MSFLSLIKNLIDQINDINPTRVEKKRIANMGKKDRLLLGKRFSG